MSTLVAVADAVGRQARLVAALRAACAAADLELVVRTHAELVAEVTVEQGLDRPPQVEPDRPLLWLSPGDATIAQTSSDRFLASERATAARSIATLTRATVLNRPTADGPCGTLPGRPSLAARRTRPVAGVEVRPERFASDGVAGADEEVFDYGCLQTSFGTAPDARGPFRHRPALPQTWACAVAVVGDRVLGGATAQGTLDEASRAIACSFDLDLAIIWWLIAPERRPTLARVDAWPYDGSLIAAGLSPPALAGALVGWVHGRVAGGPAVAT